MKTFIFIFMLVVSFSLSAQDCECVRAAVIGTKKGVAFSHNNIMRAMDNVTVKVGEPVLLTTKESRGKVSWYLYGDTTKIINLIVQPRVTTQYIVKSELTGCPDAIDSVTVFVDNSIGAGAEGKGVSIYPSPINNNFTVYSSIGNILQIKIYNLSGLLVMSCHYDGQLPEVALNVSNFPKGIYVLYVDLTDNKKQVKKIIKN
ncbi:MAG: T9SS type A sorting domain-containing protein [Bacteroidia bacterium]|nr:T9SS type A sorting domain-containing protein [Bacteroidia bacterium]